MLCAIAASNPDLDTNYTLAAAKLDWEPQCDAWRLAHDAWWHCYAALTAVGAFKSGANNWFVVEAEAESLLRTGWTP